MGRPRFLGKQRDVPTLQRILSCRSDTQSEGHYYASPKVWLLAKTGRTMQHALPKLLITAGPTHEPIDAVRYIANRSSGRVGVEIARAALRAGWVVTLALGPTPLVSRAEQITEDIEPPARDTPDPAHRFRLIRFRTTEELRSILADVSPNADALVMAAAVADYRPERSEHADGKIRRQRGGMTLHLEATPDLLAEVSARRRASPDSQPGLIVAFALEPSDGLIEAAAAKLKRKGADLIVANPLETMDAGSISASLLSAGGAEASTPGEVSKSEFGTWLISELKSRVRIRD